MDSQRRRDFLALCDMVKELKTEVVRLSSILAKVTGHGVSPTFTGADDQCDVHPQSGTPDQPTGIQAPDIPTVQIRPLNGTCGFFHKCYMCRRRFESRYGWPEQCPRCGSRVWMDGETVLGPPEA